MSLRVEARCDVNHDPRPAAKLGDGDVKRRAPPIRPDPTARAPIVARARRTGPAGEDGGGGALERRGRGGLPTRVDADVDAIQAAVPRRDSGSPARPAPGDRAARAVTLPCWRRETRDYGVVERPPTTCRLRPAMGSPGARAAAARPAPTISGSRSAAEISASEPSRPRASKRHTLVTPAASLSFAAHGCCRPIRRSNRRAEAICEMVRQFADEQILPNAEHYDHEDEFPEPIVEQMKELGLFGVTIPEEYGGMGLDLTTYAMIVEELQPRLDQHLRDRQHALHRLLSADEVRHRRAEAEVPAEDGHRRDPGRLLPVRARAGL